MYFMGRVLAIGGYRLSVLLFGCADGSENSDVSCSLVADEASRVQIGAHALDATDARAVEALLQATVDR